MFVKSIYIFDKKSFSAFHYTLLFNLEHLYNSNKYNDFIIFQDKKEYAKFEKAQNDSHWEKVIKKTINHWPFDIINFKVS